jgi:dephospho-CoA kinase
MGKVSPFAIRVIGLTGGIATGKSSVSSILRELGADLIDADQLAREVVEPNAPAYPALLSRFPEAFDSAGRLDRAKLAERVFRNPAERAALNAITHPHIHQRFLEQLQELARRGVDLVVYDVPLLIENGLQTQMDGVILVTAPVPLQLQRLMARNGLSLEQAEARLSSQMPISEKLRHATWVIDNSGDSANTREQVRKLWRSLR